MPDRDDQEQPSGSGTGMFSGESDTEDAGDTGTGPASVESVSAPQFRPLLDTSRRVPSRVRRELQIAAQADL